MWEQYTLSICTVTPVLLMVCDYSFWFIGVFYVLMPPKRVFTRLRTENAPSTISHREISQYLDSAAAAAAITKAISSHVDLFSDSSGVFELVSFWGMTPVYVYKFKTTVRFTDSHTQAKYHKLVPNPLRPEIHVPTSLEMPFRALDFAPVFASDECSYLALSNIDQMRFQESDICNVNIVPLAESSRKSFFCSLSRRPLSPPRSQCRACD